MVFWSGSCCCSWVINPKALLVGHGWIFPFLSGCGASWRSHRGRVGWLLVFSVVMMRSCSAQHHLTSDLLLGSDRMTVNGTTTPLFALNWHFFLTMFYCVFLFFCFFTGIYQVKARTRKSTKVAKREDRRRKRTEKRSQDGEKKDSDRTDYGWTQ